MAKLIFEVKIEFDDVHELKSSAEDSVAMVDFHGSVKSDIFTGSVLRGGTDTQVQRSGRRTLSARYMLEGVDAQNKPCRIFIENNAAFPRDPHAELRTKPFFMTDSPSLKWLETCGNIYGTIAEQSGVLTISFWVDCGNHSI